MSMTEMYSLFQNQFQILFPVYLSHGHDAQSLSLTAFLMPLYKNSGHGISRTLNRSLFALSFKQM